MAKCVHKWRNIRKLSKKHKYHYKCDKCGAKKHKNTPNKLTIKAINNCEKGKNVNEFSNIDDLFDDLET